MKETYQDALGKTFLVLEYDPTHPWVHADFIGVLSLMSIQKGMNAVLEKIKQHKLQKYLSDNTHIIGGWNIANDWLRDTWTPQAMQAGMRYVAHVMAPGHFGQHSMEELAPGLPPNLNLKFFRTIPEAEQWLSQLP